MGGMSLALAASVSIEPRTTLKKSMPASVIRSAIAKAEFAIRTPYPGTPQWYELKAAGRILHTDWSRYNDANVVFQPKQMSPDRLLEGYLGLWREFYSTRTSLSDAGHFERTIQF